MAGLRFQYYQFVNFLSNSFEVLTVRCFVPRRLIVAITRLEMI